MHRVTLLAVMFACACSVTERGARGERGPQGEPGPAGEQGPEGRPGERGEMGSVGATGERGEPGEVGARGSEGSVGTQGPQGERGDAGPQGAQGTPGEMGIMGTMGAMGAPGPAGRFDLEDANGLRLGTLITADIPDVWWVMNEEDTIVGYSYFGGALRTLGGGNSDLYYVSSDCTGEAYALIAVGGAGITNSGTLYRQFGPAHLDLSIHSLRPASGAACMEDITSTRNAMAVEAVGAVPADGVIPFRLVERP